MREHHHFRRASLSPAPDAGIGLQSGLDGSCPFPDEDSASPFSYRQPDNPERDHTMPFILLSDDELIARLLIHTWTLTTGKTLRGDVPPHELAEEELIDFWSDDRFD
jgi:hypothetical protein